MKPRPLRVGIYRKLNGPDCVGILYQFLLLARHHMTGDHFVVYIPLRIEPELAGTICPCILERELFADKFEFVSEALPKDDSVRIDKVVSCSSARSPATLDAPNAIEYRNKPPCATCGHSWNVHGIPGGVQNIDIYPNERHCFEDGCMCRNYLERLEAIS